MGSFSWLKADDLTNKANIAYGKPYKFLIPKKFGGGFIKDYYQDYGLLGLKEDGKPKYDMYEILAFWNYKLIIKNNEILKSNKGFENLKTIDEFTRNNRSLGIDIGCYPDQIDKLEYPLKLVSLSYKGKYEDLNTYSYGDPYQGCGSLSRKNLKIEFNHIKKTNNDNLNINNYKNFLIESFLLDKNTVIPDEFYNNDSFWIEVISKNKEYIQFLPDILKNDESFLLLF